MGISAGSFKISECLASHRCNEMRTSKRASAKFMPKNQAKVHVPTFIETFRKFGTGSVNRFPLSLRKQVTYLMNSVVHRQARQTFGVW